MTDFFAGLPTNRARIFVEMKLRGGCLLFVPALNDNHAQFLKRRLQRVMAQQPDEPPPVAA